MDSSRDEADRSFGSRFVVLLGRWFPELFFMFPLGGEAPSSWATATAGCTLYVGYSFWFIGDPPEPAGGVVACALEEPVP